MRLVLLWLLVICGSGCSALTKNTVDSRSISDRQAELAALQDWDVSGRIALNSATEGTNLALSWKQRSSDYTVALTAPLGAQVVTAVQLGNQATLQVRGQGKSTGRTVEELVRQHLSVPVPMRQLSFWLKGLPGAGENPSYDKYGRLSSLDYNDFRGTTWKAVVTGYTQTSNIDLPALIKVTGAKNVIMVSIREWVIGDATAPAEVPKPGPVMIPGVSS